MTPPLPMPTAKQVAQKEEAWKGMGSPGTRRLRDAMAATEVLRIVSEVGRVSRKWDSQNELETSRLTLFYSGLWAV